MTQTTLPVFIGYDEREHIPFLVTRDTTLRNTPSAKVYSLNHRDLREKGLFDRPWTMDETGQYHDVRDGRPFSVQFSHSRFLTPFLAKQKHSDAKYAIFMDCDFVVKENLENLIEWIERNNPNKAVWVVKHDYKPENTHKMDGMVQAQYNKKLWSAFVVYNLRHPANVELTPDYINKASGKHLHSFGWLPEELIGSIPEEWHFVAGHTDQRIPAEQGKVFHWTEGGPWFRHYKDCALSYIWLDAYDAWYSHNDKYTLLYGAKYV